MAVFFNNDCKFTLKIGSGTAVDLSNHVTSATLDWKYDKLEVTSQGQLAHAFIKGLQSGNLSLELNNDTATSSVLQTFNSAVATNSACTVVLAQSKTDVISATNPYYTFDIIVDSFTPIVGAVGELSKISGTWDVVANSTGGGVVVTTA